MAAPPHISVVIPTRDRLAKLSLTLDHLARQNLAQGWEVVVVANNCSDDTVAAVRARATDFPVSLDVIEEATPGATAARNAGARHARAADVLFLDDDILVEPGCMARVIHDRHTHPGAWIVGQGFALPEHRATPFGQFREASMPPVPVDRPVERVAWFASGIALVPKEDLLALGGYAEDYSRPALEDADLAIRATQAGFVLMFDPGLTFLHNDWAGTSIRDYCRRERIYCSTAPLLERRFGPTIHPWSELIGANRPPTSADTLTGRVRKGLKRLAGSEISQSILLGAAEWLERRRAPSSVLWPVYRAAIAGSMYAGYQEGLRETAERPSVG